MIDAVFAYFFFLTGIDGLLGCKTVYVPLLLQLESRVNGSDTKSEVLIALAHNSESSILNHLCKLLLRRELADGLNEVLVRISVIGDDLAHCWDHVEREHIVHSVKENMIFARQREIYKKKGCSYIRIIAFEYLCSCHRLQHFPW